MPMHTKDAPITQKTALPGGSFLKERLGAKLAPRHEIGA
jgi:hypothetical protein